MSKTIFCDIDGCIQYQPDNFLSNYEGMHPQYLEGSREKLLEWYSSGHRIILTTGRPEQERDKLVAQFLRDGVFYHQLIMDCGSNSRYLINDRDPKILTNKAWAINIDRNQGLEGIDLHMDGRS